MKLNLIQFIAFSFIVGWVCGQILKASYETCLYLGLLGAFIAGYLNNAHGITYKKLKVFLTKT